LHLVDVGFGRYPSFQSSGRVMGFFWGGASPTNASMTIAFHAYHVNRKQHIIISLLARRRYKAVLVPLWTRNGNSLKLQNGWSHINAHELVAIQSILVG
jgi:hypothetical protein